jgi:hypothetical protein
MKKLSIFLAFLFVVASLSAQWPANMGPDDYGYTAETFDDNDQRYGWTDISMIGTAVDGLTDDNAVGPFDLGFDFQFYWLKYNQFYIGSNGYLSLGLGNLFNYSSLGSGFDTLGTQDDKQDVIGGMLCDLTFDKAGNPGKVYFYTNGQDLAIISFEDVPFWTDEVAAGYRGRNSFQIHLSAVDSSIKILYRDQDDLPDSSYLFDTSDPNFDISKGPVLIGIENVTSNFSLSVNRFVDPADILPTPGTGIIFKAPANPLTTVTDVTTTRIQNDQSAGFFIPINGLDVTLEADLFNAGSADIKTRTSIDGTIAGQAGLLFEENVIIDSINSGESVRFAFPEPLVIGSPASYELVIEVFNNGDENGNNDFNTLEVNALDTAGGKVVFDYTQIEDLRQVNESALWTDGGGTSGIGTYIEPYAYPTTIEAMEVFLLPNAFGGANSDTFPDGDIRLTLHLGTPDQGIPGNNKVLDTIISKSDILLGSGLVNTMTGQPVPGAWNKFDLVDPIQVDSGGIFAAWYHMNDSVVLGGESTFPISRRTYEILGDSWAPHRSRDNEDYGIRLHADISAVVFDTTPPTNIVPVQTDIVSFEAYPNPSEGLVTIEASFEAATQATVRITNMNGSKLYYNYFNGVSGLNEAIDLRTAAKGIYFIQVETPKGISTKKLTIQ